MKKQEAKPVGTLEQKFGPEIGGSLLAKKIAISIKKEAKKLATE
jgi:hypothetical protein